MNRSTIESRAIPTAVTLFAICLCQGLQAQDPGRPLDRVRAALAIASPETRLGRVEIRAGDAATAAGPDYKVQVRGADVRFLPSLGRDASALPLGWRTQEVRIGTVPLELPPAVRRVAGPHRIELHRGVIVEAYDVRVDGLEQTFVLRDKPRGGGDLEIIGVLDTELRAAPVEPRHGPLTFVDPADRAVVRYGAAFAVDADGRKTDLATSFDGSRISLHVPRAVLDRATYPLVVDPLIGVTAAVSSQYRIGEISLSRSELGVGSFVFAYEEWRSSSDGDVWVWECDQNFGNLRLVFTERGVENTHSPTILGNTLAFVNATGDHVEIKNLLSSVRVRIPLSGGTRFARPQLCRTISNDTLLACKQGDGSLLFRLLSAAQSRIYTDASIIQSFSIPRRLGMTSGFPVVFTVSQGFDRVIRFMWLDASDLSGTKVYTPPGQPADIIENLQMDGEDGEFLLAYSTARARQISTMRMTETSSGHAAWGEPVVIATLPGGDIRGYELHGLAGYQRTGLWSLTYSTFTTLGNHFDTVYADLLGSGGEVVERHSLKTGMNFARGSQHAAVAPYGVAFVGEAGGRSAVYLGGLVSDSTALWRYYGHDCGSGRIGGYGLPVAGAFRNVTLRNVTGPATLLVSLHSNALALDGIGMEGCQLSVGSLVAAIPVGGRQWPVPSFVHDIDVFFQYVYAWSGGNSLGLGATQGLHLRSR